MKPYLPSLTEEVSQSLPLFSEQGDPNAGFGALTTARGCLPLKALDVQARIDGLLARIALTQTFVNNHAEPLEATYVFPLPDRAAVTRFRLEVGGRVIEGQLKERGEARQEYDRAVQAGHRAAITEEERPGVFTLRVGNLPPGEEATVRLTLTGPLPYSDGQATFRFPLVVAPRYIPGTALPGPAVGAGVAADTDAVPDASRISPPVLLPGFPNPVCLSLTVEVAQSPLSPRDFRSSLHTVCEEGDDHSRRFRLHPGERLNRDFILRFRVGENRINTCLNLQPDNEGSEGTFLLTLVPPANEVANKARDIVFVLDRSGSMSGWKMIAARRALARMVDTLTDQDRFTVLAFDDTIETPPGFGDRLLAGSDRQRFQAVEFLARIEARGGTEMAQPLDQAVTRLVQAAGERPNTSAGYERILVLVTDGQVGNEDQILRTLGPRLKGIRVFTLGIDRAVNAAFLKRLADLGGGVSELVESEDRLDEVMTQVHRHIGTPVLTGLRLEPMGVPVVPNTLVPSRLPDLFAGTPLFLMGRYRGVPEGGVVVQGRDNSTGSMWSERVPGRVAGPFAPEIGSLWARGRVRELEDRYVLETGDRTALAKEIVATSLRFGVLCRFTAYVAVDRSEVVNPGGKVHQITQPVEQPEGWEMAQTVQSGTRMAHSIKGHAQGAFGAQSLSPQMCRSAPPPAPASATPSGGPVESFLMECDIAGYEETVDARPPKSELRYSRSRKKSKIRPVSDQASRGAAQPLGLLERLLSLFRRRTGRKDPGKDAQAAVTIDRGPYRQRGFDVFQHLQGPTDAAAQLSVLRSLFAKLEELFKDLVAAGDLHPTTQRLGEVLIKVRLLLAENTPAEERVLDLWTQTQNALRDWLALAPAAPEPAPREGFWK